jgi:DNA segregation ATPase FtsK/SpoIIIE-like protein
MKTRDVLVFQPGNPYLYKTDQELDELFDDAAKLVIEGQNASASYLQRKMDIGYARAARILDELEQMGIVGPADGAKPREVGFKVYKDYVDYKNGSSPGAKTEEHEDFSHYVLPKVKLESLHFEPHVWEIPFGLDQTNQPVTSQLEKIGHLLVIGNPQCLKMEFVDTILCSQLLCCTPDQIRFVIIDPSNHLQIYNGIPHLLSRVIESNDKSRSAFYWTSGEVSRRFKIFAQAGVRTFSAYNKVPDSLQLPRIVFVMRLCEEPDKEIQALIARLTSIASAAGIHLVLIYDFAGSRYIPREIKANLPNVLVFRTTSSTDSNLAGVDGAEKLSPDEAILKEIDLGEQTKIKWASIAEGDVRKLIVEIKKGLGDLL